MKPKFKRNISRYSLGITFAMGVISGITHQASAEPVEPIASEVLITGPTSIRAVQGTVLNPLRFSIENLNESAPTNFNLTLSPGSVGQFNSLSQPSLPSGTMVTNATGTPWNGVTLGSANIGTISATPNIAGLIGGQKMSFGIEASNSNWTGPVNASADINVVANRLLTGSSVINAGRHVVGSQIGSVTLNSGVWSDSQATRISVMAGGQAQLSNGLLLSSTNNFTFSRANKTSDLKVVYNGPLGNYNIASTALPSGGSNSYTDTLGNMRHEFGGTSPSASVRINPLISSESIQGSSLNLSGVTLAATGTAVTNRLLTGSTTINAGRHMVGMQPVGSITLSGGAWTDSEATRIAVSSGGNAQLANGLRLTTDFTFNGANQTHNLQVSYNGPTGAYNITAASLPGADASNYKDVSGNTRQEFGGRWNATAQYGNVLGEKRVFSANDSVAWSQPNRPLYDGYHYIYRNELTSTPQPVFSPTTYSHQVGSLLVDPEQSSTNVSTHSFRGKLFLAAV
jgi:hypothetical protein